MFQAEHLGNQGTWRTKFAVFRVEAHDPSKTDINYMIYHNVQDYTE